jgi:CBS domain containing-hemolysin-like protein
LEYLFDILILLLLLAFSAFFSGSETAIFHLSRVSIEKIAQKFPIIRRREELLGTILLGNTLVNAGASIVAAKIFYRLGGTYSYLPIVVGIMTYVILVVGEFSPKLYSIRNAEKVSLKALFGLNLIRYILSPVTLPLNLLIRTPLAPSRITKKELKTLVEYEKEEKNITDVEKEFIMNLLSLEDIRVKNIMTNREKIEALPLSTEIDEEKISKISHSRIPIYKNNLDHIEGILYIKDLLSHEGPSKVKKIIRQPHFVYESMSVNELFSYFQKTGVHIVIVVDENRSTKGVVTFDDILNLIIGKV